MFLYVIMFSQRGRKLGAGGNEFDDTEEGKLAKIAVASDGAVINLNNLQTSVNTNSAKTTFPGFGTTTGTALQGSTSVGCIKHLLYMKPMTPSYYAMTGTYGAITGSLLPGSTELTTDPLRMVIGSLGIVQDTESPNNFTFSESDSKITFGWTQQVVLVFYKMEYVDNSAGERLLTFGMYDDYHNTNKFSIRTHINMPSSNYTFKQISGFAGAIAIQSYANYFMWAQSSGGGKIQGVEFYFIRSNLNF